MEQACGKLESCLAMTTAATGPLLATMNQALRSRTAAHLPEITAMLLVAVIGATVWLGFEYRQEVAAVQHTLEVEKNLSRLLSIVQDAETGQRGFLLTGDDVYLDVHGKAVAEIAGELDVLQAITAGSPEQQSTVANIRPLMEQRFALLQEGITIRRREGLAAAARFIQTNQGRDVMLLIRAGIAGMQQAEAKLLLRRSATEERLVQAVLIAAASGILLVFLSMAAWIYNQRRDARRLAAEVAERQAAEAQMRQMQKIEALGQLTGGIAHDFNNMLAVVISGLSLIKRRIAAGNSDVLELADAAIDGANRAAALTNRLMAFARQQPLAPQAIDANQLIGSMTGLIDRALGETIRLESVLETGLWTTHADPSQLESALLNLCVNARDAMPGGGRLSIETSNCEIGERFARQVDVPAGQYICIAVGDTGAGMPPDVVARVFDPFFTTKDVGKGTGLGLSQVHGFIKQSGGHIKIYSEPGHGTTVRIYLRRHIAAALDPGFASPPIRLPMHHADPGQVILVVEDDERVRELSISMLQDLGYIVLQADGAEAALRRLDERPEIAVLFTDVVMPETSGRELAEQALLRRPDLRVLFTSGFTRDAAVQGGVPQHGVNFIAKPFTLEQLAAKLSAVLAGGAAK